MNKTTLSIFFAVAFVFSGCTVHHYHHHAPSRDGKTMRHHKGAKGGAEHGLPPGHPPVRGMYGHDLPKGHPKVKGMRGHKKGHGMRGHGKRKMPKGHGKRKMPKDHGKPHHDTSDQGVLPPGHPPVEHHKDRVHAPHGAKAGQDGHGKHVLPAEVDAFHTSFAAAWHTESDATRRTAACARLAEWKTLAQGVKKLKGGAVFVAATKDLHRQILSVASSCARKKGDVQSALVATHDALHMLFRVLPKSGPTEAPGAQP